MRKGVLLKRFRIVECFSYLELARSSLLKKYQLCSPSVHIVISTFKQLQLEWIEVQFRFNNPQFRNGILFQELFWPNERKKNLVIQKNIFDITRTTYSHLERSENFLKQNAFLAYSWRFLRSNILEKLEFKLEKK